MPGSWNCFPHYGASPTQTNPMPRHSPACRSPTSLANIALAPRNLGPVTSRKTSRWAMHRTSPPSLSDTSFRAQTPREVPSELGEWLLIRHKLARILDDGCRIALSIDCGHRSWCLADRRDQQPTWMIRSAHCQWLLRLSSFSFFAHVPQGLPRAPLLAFAFSFSFLTWASFLPRPHHTRDHTPHTPSAPRAY